jgi:glycosyltransferase involved in cell wall biosynthesis
MPADSGSPATPELTVVIPTHNRLDYLQEAIDSVLSQGEEPLQLIVVDDNSEDGTSEWLATIEDPRVRSFRQSPGRGGSAARNLGLSHCSTPFVMFCDDDDVLVAGGLHKLANALRRHPNTAGAAGTYVRFGSTDHTRREIQPRVTVTTPVWRELLFSWNMQPGALLWRTDVVREIGGWNEALPRCEDRDINLRAYPRPFTLISDIVMRYRIHPAQSPAAAQVELTRRHQEEFVDSLPGQDRLKGQAIMEAHVRFLEGLALYESGRFSAARSTFIETLRTTGFASSKVLGPWLVGLVAKSTVASVLPSDWGINLKRLAGSLRS